jgi:hypothetical protein
MSGSVRAWLFGLVLTLVVASVAAVARDRLGSPDRCSVEGADLISVTGRQDGPVEKTDLSRRTVLDAHDASWRGRDHYIVELTGSARACLSGGSIQGTWPADTSWSHMHGTAAVIVDTPRATVEDVRVDGYGDSVRIVGDASGFVVRRVHLSDSRDDCVENDDVLDGTVSDSLLDGCYNAFSARPYRAGSDGSDHLWTIRDSLVRLQPMERTYHDEGPEPGTAGFFKWDEKGPRITLTGNVFRADQDAGPVGLGVPADKIATCSRNTMVWLGEGPYPAPLPPCFTLTRDKSVWDDAVRRWERHHS